MRNFLRILVTSVAVHLMVFADNHGLIQFDEKEMINWMERFIKDPFFQEQIVASVTAEKRATVDDEFENLRGDLFLGMQDAEDGNFTDVFNSHIHYFPANVVMVQAMYKLMKPKGVLNEEGFSKYGHMSSDGSARVLFNRAFASEKELLDTLNNSRGKRLSDLQMAIGDFDKKKPLVAVTNYLLSPADVKRSEDWLKKQVKLNGGHVRHSLQGSRVMLVISYACCAKTRIPLLTPKYGTMKLRVG